VIGGALAKGVDLQGDGSLNNEEPASGPTLIRGNYIGLGGNGTAVVANAEYGVLAGAADSVQVGGTGEGETNNFAGGLYGVYGENGDSLEVLSNVFGRDRSGGATTAPSAAGIFNISNGITFPARLAYNSMEMSSGVGIEQRFTGAEIVNNDVWGGAANGIVVKGSSVGEGNLIERNRIRNTTSDGIVVENDSNVVVGNEVLEAMDCGILVRYTGTLPLASGSTENRIGGDEEFEENELVANGLAAIRIEDLEGTENEVARNHGKENGGPFIDLVTPEPGSEPNGPNEGVKPPFVTKATLTGAEGLGAEAGAKVRVFRKASSEPGELESFLAETTADSFGNWSVTFPASIPAGTLVTATQTSLAGGTSELFMPPITAESGGGGGEEKGGGGGSNGGGTNNGGGNNGGGNTKDKTPPDTKIVKGPPKKTHKTTVKFKFTSTEAGSAFQCKLDKKPFKACVSPKKYKKLKPGKHVFKVRAIDKTGNVDPTPAKRAFTVLAG
jgi:Right handed beta helix region